MLINNSFIAVPYHWYLTLSLISVSRIVCKFWSDLRHAKLYLFPHRYKINDNIASNFVRLKHVPACSNLKYLHLVLLIFKVPLISKNDMAWLPYGTKPLSEYIANNVFSLEQTTLCRVPYYANNSLCSIQLDDRLKHTLLFFYRDI